MQKTLPKKEKDRRAKVMVVIIAIAFLACVGNLFRIQVVQADYYKGKAEENQLYDTEIPAQRGTIYDSEGNVLAQSASVWLVYIDPYSVPDDSVRADLCRDLSNALGINGDTLMKKLKMTKYRYLVIAKQVEYDNKEKVVEIKKKKYVYGKKGEEQYAYGSAMVGIDPDVKRYYPNGNLASHIIGYTNSEGNGQAGIELYYNSILSGIPGRKVTAKDAYGRAMPLQYETLYDATNGQKLQLTVNSNIQRYLEEALKQAYIDNKCAYANGIVMDVNTGAILGMATMSDYDPNNPRQTDDAEVEEEYKRLQELRAAKYEESGKTPTEEEIKKGQEEDRNNAKLNVFYNNVRNQNVSSTYEPGSVFKTITASAALDQGVADQSTKVDCVAGGIKILTQTYHCNAHTVHGTLDMVGGLKKSCNSYFITMGQRLGVDNFYKYFEAFGFTEKTGIDLPAETQPKAGRHLPRPRRHDAHRPRELLVRSVVPGHAHSDGDCTLRHSQRRKADEALCRRESARRQRQCRQRDPADRQASGDKRGDLCKSRRDDAPRRQRRHGEKRICYRLPRRGQDRVPRRSSARPASTSRPTDALPPRTIRKSQ